MKDVLYEVRCLKSSPVINPVSARIISSFDFKHRTSYNTSFNNNNNDNNNNEQNFVSKYCAPKHMLPKNNGKKRKNVLQFLFVILSHIYFSQSPGVGDVALTIHIQHFGM